jgi:hypothetical protein
MTTGLTREDMEIRGEEPSRGNPDPRGYETDRGEAAVELMTLTRSHEKNVKEEYLNVESQHVKSFFGKKIGSPIVVFPNNIANGSYVPGTLVKVFDGILQISVGVVVIQDGAWKPVRPFVAGDQVFVPIRSIDTFV